MKMIAIIDVPDGEGKWYIDGEIRYTEDESLMKRFDKEMIPLRPMPEQMLWGHSVDYLYGYNDCLEEITGEKE